MINRADYVKSIKQSVLGGLGLLIPSSKSVAREKGDSEELLILCYHNIVPNGSHDVNCNDFYFLNLPRDLFEMQMEWVSRHFRMIGLDELMGGGPIPRRSALVTFDDGFKSVYTEAFPVLERLGATGTVFLTGAQVKENRVPWISHLHCIVDSLPPKGASLIHGGKRYSLSTKKERFRFLQEIKSVLKSKGIHEISETLFSLERQSGFSLPQGWASHSFLSPDDLKELSAHGWTVGNHTFNHVNLRHLTPEAVAFEILETVKVLHPLEHFRNVMALPFGGEDSFSREVMEVARDAGVKYVFSTLGRMNHSHHEGMIDRIICETFSFNYFKLLAEGKKNWLGGGLRASPPFLREK